jgi:N-acetyl-gamma-glutamyl-phosphate reductase
MKLTHEFFTRLVLETIYLQPTDPDVTEDELFEAYEDAYTNDPFIRVRENLPNLKHVVGTNYCDLSVRPTHPGGRPTIIVFSVIDNMIKGASGQALQNMNVVFDLDETTGLV